jgi:truncated hemoglobin YjbI
MQNLQDAASALSGVSQEDAFEIDQHEEGASVFERVGHAAFVKLSTAFYDRVYADEDAHFRLLFASRKKEDAIRNQYEFFIQRLGGPQLYSQRKGHPALIGRHMEFEVSGLARRFWAVALLWSLSVHLSPRSSVPRADHAGRHGEVDRSHGGRV